MTGWKQRCARARSGTSGGSASVGLLFDWQRRGLVFAPDGRHEWMHSHAQNPTMLKVDGALRVYFNCRAARDASGNTSAYATFVDLDAADPLRVMAVARQPVLGLGDCGTFDQFGVMAGSVIRNGAEVWMYYVGWARALGVPYHHAIGIAVSRDGGQTFTRRARGPALTRTPAEPFIQNSPFVCRIGAVYHMWYSSGTEWIAQPGAAPESIYVVMHATSQDGLAWERDGVPCIANRVEFECQTNPSVLRIGSRYHMWFCYRHGVDFRNVERGYRIGYAWSDDLATWHRDDAAGGFEVAPEGWDSEMVCYPNVHQIDDRLVMFYSGNYFGRDGFGMAECAMPPQEP